MTYKGADVIVLSRKAALTLIKFLLPIIHIGVCNANPIADIAKEIPISAEYETEHFIFRLYDDLVVGDISEIAKGLEVNFDRIVNDLKPDNVPRMYVHLFNKKESWSKISPTQPFGGAFVTRENDTDNIWAYFWNDREFAAGIEQIRKSRNSISSEQLWMHFNITQTAIHEFVHLVMVNVDERIGNNPRWLWESVALYEANQSFDPVMNGYTLQEIQIPFSELERSFHLYMLGYHITDYIVSEWGISSVRQLIKTQGETQKVLKLSLAQLEKGFWRFMDCNYFKESDCH